MDAQNEFSRVPALELPPLRKSEGKRKASYRLWQTWSEWRESAWTLSIVMAELRAAAVAAQITHKGPEGVQQSSTSQGVIEGPV